MIDAGEKNQFRPGGQLVKNEMACSICFGLGDDLQRSFLTGPQDYLRFNEGLAVLGGVYSHSLKGPPFRLGKGGSDNKRKCKN